VILVIGGQIAAGKTSLAIEFSLQTQGRIIRVREALAELLDLPVDDRVGLQVGGAELDRRSNGRWLCEYVAARSESADVLVVDSVRTLRQGRPLLERLRDTRLVFLSASESTRRARYASALGADPLKASLSFDAAMHHPTELDANAVASIADLIVETDDLTPEQVVQEVKLGLSW
jgi:adenylosuccinate synthase